MAKKHYLNKFCGKQKRIFFSLTFFFFLMVHVIGICECILGEIDGRKDKIPRL